VAWYGGADSMLRFQLESGSDWMKHCQKIKWRHRARLGSREGIVTRCCSMTMSAGGEVAPGRGYSRLALGDGVVDHGSYA
jgi:hypothetical protein